MSRSLFVEKEAGLIICTIYGGLASLKPANQNIGEEKLFAYILVKGVMKTKMQRVLYLYQAVRKLHSLALHIFLDPQSCC